MKKIHLYWQNVPVDTEALNDNSIAYLWFRKGMRLFLNNTQTPQEFINKFNIVKDNEISLRSALLLHPEELSQDEKDDIRKLLIYALQPIYNTHTDLALKNSYNGGDYIIVSWGCEFVPRAIQSHNNNVFFNDFYPPKEVKGLIKVSWSK